MLFLNLSNLHPLTRHLTKISLFLTVTVLLISCNAVKRVPADKFLLTENTIVVDSVEINDAGVYSQLYQRPNPKIPLLGIPFGLHIYNLADPHPDSTYQRWLHRKPEREERLVNFISRKQVEEIGNSYVGFNEWLEESGDAPVIISEEKTEKSLDRIKSWYAKRGWFNTTGDYTITPSEKKDKRASVKYNIQRYQPYIIDSITTEIASPVVDSLFQDSKNNTFIKSGQQYAASDFQNERDRLTIQFRNSGLFHFDQDYVRFEGDTVNTGHKANITYLIPNRKITVGDSTYTEEFKVHRINQVRVVTDYLFENRNERFQDSANYKGYKIYSYDDLAYRPKAITDAISIAPNAIFKDIDRTLTYNQISDLRIFKYPSITYQEDKSDTTGTGLIATVLLSPKKKYTLGVDFDAYTSTIQPFGIGFSSSFLIRNVFRGAETLELTAGGSVGSSADRNSSFFDTSDLGADVKLSFPSILFPLNTDKIIPKYMSPSTNISIGFNAQNNIGLDRQNLSTIFNYQWKPSKIKNYRLDLLNIQYVRNLNVENYFNVFRSSFEQLNDIAQNIEINNPGTIDPEYYTLVDDELQLTIPSGANNFIDDVLMGTINPISGNRDDFDTVRTIDERKDRLTENNLIFASNFTWTRDTRENIFDKNFSRIRWKIETAGNLLSGIASLSNFEKNENGNFETLGVAFSQYAKGEFEYIKHWALNADNIFAIRTFGGLAVPYGNSRSIPFTRSYFAGGANDNRGWRAYELGPGSSGNPNEFNDANLKIALNAEYRYTILGAFKGAFFVDTGNIWNIFDNVEDPASRFEGIGDLKELAVASGFGLRYDFGFFVLRFDIGFKTHDPARPEGERWFKDYNFNNAVYNIGINYPF
ncbi:MAG: BamA/TamA family outer membrane protein [Flavobacteriales bacterium]|jgi:outer membrane protein assembly factor BamA|nr:BamA/TamA family outer membrane protein [Flavobacteriales bacterium]